VGEYSPQTTKSILWHAGALTVSICGIQISKSASGSPKVFATARQDSKVDYCINKLGCNRAVNTSHPEWRSELSKATDDNGADLIIDFIGGPYFAANLELAARDSKIVGLGLMGGGMTFEPVDISPFLKKRVKFEGSTLRSRNTAYQVKVKELFEKIVLPKLVDGSFENIVTKVFKWEDIQEAN
jgi:NADPH:quinone reductase-like Zn-dependent oxidoreductase